ncbi:sigma-70 family RNA polymerase sigma factor [Nocardia puris]|uniref:RNA polymerase sigma-70 factor (ECF subfamily) n=1 Tax=Nocardia puris TaxID=208602 RepID=A0A366DVT0_9NOCA|nr:sigma-70 family RNA polymerase sigma factor [Nocardia puris]MBF6210056.1 sigma-70 family RNA polymerase sigma factor [Nocardia puris]MBF6368247.1 sigma-70 family RNA polymerase sigma factor [Nocardia puris]MBF6458034.1 sigma-70 family RNA polymerase sigma factor [Nocardia puris]RBO94196.1 RNA polymerase sigma-70 factor (ECF subfamily) [Nocardia puris]
MTPTQSPAAVLEREIRPAEEDASDRTGRGAPTRDESPSRRFIALVHAIGDGDRRAFTEFYRQTSHRVFGLSLRMTRNRTVAEEITQEVYLQVWSFAARYDERMCGPVGWLMMLTHRRAVDRIRSDRAAGMRDVVFGFVHLGREHDVVSETVEQRLDEQAVLRGLDALTPLQYDAVTLAYYGGLTYAEVAEKLGAPLPTVKSRIRDGLARLAAALAEGAPR